MSKTFFTKNEIINEISTLPIFDDEFDIINDLCDNLDGKLFTKILEEILLGNLTFSDFKSIFSKTEYSEILRNNLKSEEILNRCVKRYYEFKSNKMTSDKLKYELNDIILEDTPESNQLYTKEVENLRNNVLYSLFDGIYSDSPLVAEAKKTMISHIENYYNEMRVENEEIEVDINTKFYLNSESVITLDSIGNDQIVDNEFQVYITESGTLVGESYNLKSKKEYCKLSELSSKTVYKHTWVKLVKNGDTDSIEKEKQTLNSLTTRKYSITPQEVLNKILLFVNKQMLPLNVEDQVLDKTDYNFMLANNCSADEVKKLKALSLFLKKKEISFEEE